jgi:hypothetical protein
MLLLPTRIAYAVVRPRNTMRECDEERKPKRKVITRIQEDAIASVRIANAQP